MAPAASEGRLGNLEILGGQVAGPKDALQGLGHGACHLPKGQILG